MTREPHGEHRTLMVRYPQRPLPAAADLDSEEGHQVYADPAVHPFCIGWGHPSRAALAAFVADHRNAAGAGADT